VTASSTDSRRWRRHVRCCRATENSCRASTTGQAAEVLLGRATRAAEAEMTSRRVVGRRRRADAAAVGDATCCEYVN